MSTANPPQDARARMLQLMAEIEADLPHPPPFRYLRGPQQDPFDFRLNVLSMRRLETGAIRARRHELDVVRWNLEETPEYWNAVNSVIRAYMSSQRNTALIHTISDVVGWNLAGFVHPTRHADRLRDACLLSYRGQDGGCWFSYYDERLREHAYGTISMAQLNSFAELAVCPVGREDLRELFRISGRPLGGQEKDRTLCILGGRHPETRPDSDFPFGPAR